MDKYMRELIAEDISICIVEDIKNRSGLGNEWDNIDEDIQDEIQQAWFDEITTVLKEYVPEESR